MHHNGVQNNSNTPYLTEEWQKDEEREKSLSRATSTVQSNSELVRVFMLLLQNLRVHCQPIINFYFNIKGKILFFLTFLVSNFLVRTLQCTKSIFCIHFAHEYIKQFYPQKQHTLEDLIYFYLQPRMPPKGQNIKIHVENLAHQKSNNLQYNPPGRWVVRLIDQASDGPSIILIDCGLLAWTQGTQNSLFLFCIFIKKK